MERYTNTILNKQGKPVAGAVVVVTTYPSNEPAVIYAADGGQQVQSVSSDLNGRFAFYAADGHYNLSITSQHIEPVTITDIVLNDPDNDAQSSGVVSAKTFGAKGDGVTDDTAAIQSYLDSGDARIHFPDGRYIISETLILPESVKTVACSNGATIVQTADKAIWYKAGSLGATTHSLFASSVAVGSRFVSIEDASSFVPDEWIFLRCNNLTPNVTAGSRVSFLRKITAVSYGGNVLYFDAATFRPMSISMSLRKISLGGRVVFEGGTYTSINQENFKPLFDFVLCHGPDINGVTIRDSGGAGIRLAHCVGGSFNASHIENLRDDKATSHFGYGVALNGATRGFMFNSGTVGKVRHAITTASYQPTFAGNVRFPALDASTKAYIELHGEPEACYYGPVYCYSTTNAAFDTHEQGYGFTITPNAHGCFEGIHIRCSNVSIVGGQVVNSRRNGMRISGPASNATPTVDYKIALTGLTISNVGLDGEGGDESTAINITYPGPELTLRDCNISGYRQIGVRVIAGSKIIVDGGTFDGLDSAIGATALTLESSGNEIRSAVIRNNGIGIREEAGCVGNSWSDISFSNNTANESRVPTYVPRNRHNSVAGAAGALNDHEVPFGYFIAGRWYAGGSNGQSSASANMAASTLRLAPLYVRQRISIDRIGAEVTVVGSAGSLLRLGLYNDNGEGYPNALILDAGTIDGAAVAAQEITVAVTLEPGLYWIGGAVQGTASTLPTIRNTTASSFSVGATSLTTAVQSSVGYSVSNISGALPGTFPAGATVAGVVPRVAVRIG